MKSPSRFVVRGWVSSGCSDISFVSFWLGLKLDFKRNQEFSLGIKSMMMIKSIIRCYRKYSNSKSLITSSLYLLADLCVLLVLMQINRFLL